MSVYTPAFEKSVAHVMIYEVGSFFNPTDPDTIAGAISTSKQRRAVGYTNDPTDRGGETKFGIAKSGNPGTNIAALTWEDAKAIYFKKYWMAGGCPLLPDRIAEMHFDGCVNNGVSRAGKFLQEIAGVLPAMRDGVVGAETAAKVRTFDERLFCVQLADRREQFYKSIVQGDPTQARFLSGWLRRIDEVQAFVLQ